MENKTKKPTSAEVIANMPRRDTYSPEHGSGNPHMNPDENLSFLKIPYSPWRSYVSNRIEDSTSSRLAVSGTKFCGCTRARCKRDRPERAISTQGNAARRDGLGSSGSPSFIAVVQSTDLWHRHDGSHFRRLNRSWLRCVLPQRKMSSRSMVIIEIQFERLS